MFTTTKSVKKGRKLGSEKSKHGPFFFFFFYQTTKPQNTCMMETDLYTPFFSNIVFWGPRTRSKLCQDKNTCLSDMK